MTTETTNSTDELTAKGHLMFSVPPELKAMIQGAAKEKGVSTSGFVRQLVADAVGFKGQLTAGGVHVRKYANEEERKAAQKARERDRRELFKLLLARYETEQGEGPVAKAEAAK